MVRSTVCPCGSRESELTFLKGPASLFLDKDTMGREGDRSVSSMSEVRNTNPCTSLITEFLHAGSVLGDAFSSPGWELQVFFIALWELTLL